MSVAGVAADSGMFFIVAAGLLGALLSLAAEFLIARFLPRLGGLPGTKTWITTAALTGCICAALAWRAGMEWSLSAFLVLGVLSVQLARIDLAHHLLPNPLVLALFAAGLGLLAVASLLSEGWEVLGRAVAGALVLFVLYLAMALISPAGIGMGDVKLAAPLGLYLGYLGWGELFYGGALGFVLGGVAAVLVATRGAGRPTEIAFGPSMLAASLGTVLYSA